MTPEQIFLAIAGSIIAGIGLYLNLAREQGKQIKALNERLLLMEDQNKQLIKERGELQDTLYEDRKIYEQSVKETRDGLQKQIDDLGKELRDLKDKYQTEIELRVKAENKVEKLTADLLTEQRKRVQAETRLAQANVTIANLTELKDSNK